MQRDTLFVFAKALDGRILFNQAAAGGAFVGWQEVPGGVTTDHAPSAAGRQDNLFVFVKANDGRILFNQAAPGAAFVGWQEVPGGVVTDAALGRRDAEGHAVRVRQGSRRPCSFKPSSAGGSFCRLASIKYSVSPCEYKSCHTKWWHVIVTDASAGLAGSD
jgi:hypothetical protein